MRFAILPLVTRRESQFVPAGNDVLIQVAPLVVSMRQVENTACRRRRRESTKSSAVVVGNFGSNRNRPTSRDATKLRSWRPELDGRGAAALWFRIAANLSRILRTRGKREQRNRGSLGDPPVRSNSPSQTCTGPRIFRGREQTAPQARASAKGEFQ